MNDKINKPNLSEIEKNEKYFSYLFNYTTDITNINTNSANILFIRITLLYLT